MKLLLLLVVSCLAFHHGKGAPMTAVYKFLRCNPEGGQANCVTMQSPEMEWSPDLPAKLPASTAEHLEAEPVEDEGPQGDEEEEEEEEDMVVVSEEGESPLDFLPDEGSGDEGSASSAFLADQPVETAESETGSGEDWTEKNMDLFKGGDRNLRKLFPSRSLAGESKPAEQEMKDDNLLHL